MQHTEENIHHNGKKKNNNKQTKVWWKLNINLLLSLIYEKKIDILNFHMFNNE